MTRSFKFIGWAAALVASAALQTSAFAASNKHKVSARLFGPTPLKGNAVYEEKPKNGQTFRRFKVEVERGVPLQSLDVFVNGNNFGTLVLNAVGRGEFQLRTASFIDDPHDGDPIPSNFPKLDTGDVIEVGPLTGIIFDQRDNSVQRIDLKGRTPSSDNVDAQAKYRERFKNGKLERRFQVEVEDASGVQSFDISVNGQLVGTLTTNNLGRGEFQLRTGAFIDSPNDGQPMPNSFPSLQAGDTVQVGDMTITLGATGGGGNGGGGGGGGGGNGGGGNGGGGGDDPPGHQ